MLLERNFYRCLMVINFIWKIYETHEMNSFFSTMLMSL